MVEASAINFKTPELSKPVGEAEEKNYRPDSSKILERLETNVEKKPRQRLKDISKLKENREKIKPERKVNEDLKTKILGVVQKCGLGEDIKDLSYIRCGLTGDVYRLTILKIGKETKETIVAVKIGKNNYSASQEQLILVKIAEAETKGKYSLDSDTTPYTFKCFGGDSKENISIMEYIPLSEEVPIIKHTHLQNLSIAIQYAHHIYLLRQAGLVNPDYKRENLHNIDGQLRITDIGLVSDEKKTLESTGQIKGVLEILSQSASPDFSKKVIELLRATDRNLIPYAQYSKKNQYEIAEIIRSAEFQKGPAEIKGLILKTLNLLKQGKKPEEMVSKEGYKELLIDVVAIGAIEDLSLPKPLNRLSGLSSEKRVNKLEQYELPPLETSGETKMSPEAIKKLEADFIQSLPKRININNIQYLLTSDEQKKALYESILTLLPYREDDAELQEGLIPNFETFITELQLLDDPKKIGIDDELIATQYSAMRSIILGLNGKQSSDFSPDDLALIKSKMEAIKKGGSKMVYLHPKPEKPVRKSEHKESGGRKKQEAKIPAKKVLPNQVDDDEVKNKTVSELPVREISAESKMSPEAEARKKLELVFVKTLIKNIDPKKIDYLLLDDIRKKALFQSVLPLWKDDAELQEGLIPNFETFITELQLLDDPKKIGIDDELIATQYLAMRSIILGLNGKQSSDFSPDDLALIKSKMEAIKKGGSKEEVGELLNEITGKIQPPSTGINSTPLISKSKTKP